MFEKAKNPQRVVEKMDECRFFLVQMAEYEKAFDTEKLLHCLSAFLGAFRTVVNRLTGVTESRNGPVAKQALWCKLNLNPDIEFLLDRRNAEVHSDGAVIYQRFSVQVAEPLPRRWQSTLYRRTTWHCSSPWDDPWQSPSQEAVVTRQFTGWQFAENPKNLIELCHDALNALEEFYRQTVAPVASSTQLVEAGH
jgi:hypothetical protein